MSKIFLVIILSIQLLTVTALYQESYDANIYTAMQRRLYSRYLLEDNYLKFCRQDLWCVEKEEPIKQNKKLIMSNDNEMKVTCIYCFNPRETLKPKSGVTQLKSVTRFEQVGDNCYQRRHPLKVSNGCNCRRN
ncbi:uncharacterized protein LOC135133758 isoform X2 [Zophobas morio]|uniref:uncharacterized protein LOC135133758 isoform X2 n=1 Tax=Zophobas morio TaxID=2755281 RepID=UPI00308317A2